jgi:predicted CoA-binding protein
VIRTSAVERFLAQPRITVVGASDAKGSFGGTVYRALRDHGYDVVPVNRVGEAVAGDPGHASLAAAPAPLGAVLVMVGAERAVDVVRDCISLGVEHVWLFQGLGGPGAVSDEALRLLDDHGIDAIAGACPLMFLEPVGLVHRVHRRVRRARGALTAA